jgi:hypothetical protein
MVDPTGHAPAWMHRYGDRWAYSDGATGDKSELEPEAEPEAEPYSQRPTNPSLPPVLNTLPGDYPVVMDWDEYLIIPESTSRFSMLDNLNPEFLGRLAALCRYFTELTGVLHTITVTQGYRTEAEQNRNGVTTRGMKMVLQLIRL